MKKCLPFIDRQLYSHWVLTTRPQFLPSCDCTLVLYKPSHSQWLEQEDVVLLLLHLRLHLLYSSAPLPCTLRGLYFWSGPQWKDDSQHTSLVILRGYSVLPQQDASLRVDYCHYWLIHTSMPYTQPVLHHSQANQAWTHSWNHPGTHGYLIYLAYLDGSNSGMTGCRAVLTPISPHAASSPVPPGSAPSGAETQSVLLLTLLKYCSVPAPRLNCTIRDGVGWESPGETEGRGVKVKLETHQVREIMSDVGILWERVRTAKWCIKFKVQNLVIHLCKDVHGISNSAALVYISLLFKSTDICTFYSNFI